MVEEPVNLVIVKPVVVIHPILFLWVIIVMSTKPVPRVNAAVLMAQKALVFVTAIITVAQAFGAIKDST